MAIADIYDALAATDRPYKKAVPMDRVFAILRGEASSGQLDADLVELFIEEKAYDVPRASAGGTQ
jgi:HD-GYP domain-containing protein (c-di-GMP phosphodiesterase class II)